MARGRARRVGTGVLGIAISIIALVVLASLIDVGATGQILVETDLRWVALTLLMVPLQVVARSARWRLLLPRRPDGDRPSVTRVMPVLLTGYFGNLVLPARLGEPVRAYLIARRESMRFSESLGSVLLERVIDLATLAVVAAVAAVAADAPAWMIQGMAIVAIVAVVIAVVLMASGIERSIDLLSRVLGARVERIRAGMEHLAHFGRGAGGSVNTVPLVGAVAISAGTWAFVGATYWMLGQSLDLGLGPMEALLIAAIATLGTAIPSAPAHIGTFQVAAVIAATAVGVPAEGALALALLAHVITTAPFALAGAATVTWMSISLTDVADQALAAAPAAANQAEPTPTAD